MKQLKGTGKAIDNPNGIFTLKLPDEFKPLVQSMLKYCHEKRNGYISFVFSPPRKPRTTGRNSQNTKLYFIMQDIAMFTGQPVEEIKEFVKSSAIDRGYPPMIGDDGKIVLNVWGRARGMSESDASTEDETLLIDQAYQLAAEYDVPLRENMNGKIDN